MTRKQCPFFFGITFLLLIICAGLYFTVNNNNKTLNPNKTQLVSASPTGAMRFQEFPKLAYIQTTGIALPEDKNTDIGTVLTINPDGTDKKMLAKFDRSDLLNIYDFPLYSPISREILKNTKKGVVAIDILTRKIRNIFIAKPKTSISLSLSNENDSVYITTVDLTLNGTTSNTKKYKVLLKDKNSIPQEINSYVIQKQPYFDSTTGKRVEVKVKDFTDGEVGRFIKSNDIIITDTKVDTKKIYTYNKPGEVESLFNANSYFYFKVNQCCASTDRLGSMTQLNLDTGEFSRPSSIPQIAQKLANTNITLENKGISPDGTYYAYTAVNNSVSNMADAKTYLYNTNTKQETELKVGVDSFIVWSSDSKFILFNYDTSKGYIYSISYQQLEETKIPSSTNYVILR